MSADAYLLRISADMVHAMARALSGQYRLLDSLLPREVSRRVLPNLARATESLRIASDQMHEQARLAGPAGGGGE